MLDLLTKKSGAFLPGALVAVAAYFQASGVAQIIGAHLVPSGAPAEARFASTTGAGDLPGKDASPILARNPFDSVTGPLDGKTVVVADVKPPPTTQSGDPYQDPACSGVTSSLVTAAEDPAWSFAALNSVDGKSQLRRRGDKVGTAEVLHIGWFNSPDPDVVPRVWLSESGTRCLVGMGQREGGPVRKTADAAPTRPTSPKSKLAAEIESKITKVGENSYVVERGAVEQIIQNYAKLAGSLRSRATKDGVRVSGIKKDSILSKVGMQNGDLLQSINGFDMTDPEKAVDAYAKLRSAGKLDITMSRDGTPTTINIAIK
ncbi:MAG TPA: type II secretion system protein GspC [Polyangiaceae bacterium]|jgi:general secretion pathway protein C|nr:type II secretion system protein GspC [Polyangiaceae bacterium]